MTDETVMLEQRLRLGYIHASTNGAGTMAKPISTIRRILQIGSIRRFDREASALHGCAMFVTVPPPVSAEQPDWSREAARSGWDPSRALLASIRSYQRSLDKAGLAVLRRNQAVLRYRFWSVVTGADIPLNTAISGGLILPHPNGVVVHPESIIGPNCLLFQQVTLAGNETGAPILEGHVDVGAGAKIIGRVRIGAHAKVGANAVVTKDVPPYATARGIPASW